MEIIRDYLTFCQMNPGEAATIFLEEKKRNGWNPQIVLSL